ncbi:DUF1800 domain-containing protein [Reichenbachiella agarivorans]|uniref:DUF1800 domain-containing protein n=1 Tax=Reichenbachiella agarivorans TaxID=2979464 RepID=A0ABY6CJZ0_9BACT|nr:DUF1800 domain-containing protein [Reichenbachiella agarivorans]UXP30842.1 DUF1800 domain-containing protein [Reichenbachiella agarivorans]
MPLTALSGTLGKKRAAHLLRRACTGGSIAEINEFAGLTAQEAFARLSLDDLPTPLPPIDPKTGKEWISTPVIKDVNSDNLDALLNAWILGQMLATDVPDAQKLSYSFRERIVFFMHILFTTQKEKVGNTKSIYYQNALFRHFAFDTHDIEIATPNPDPDSPDILPPTIAPVNLKQLTKKICVENAMLQFLDGKQNVKGSPNENFARELMELYTIGRGLEGQLPDGEFEGDYINFTEEDVQAASKVLSGFELDTDEDSLPFANLDIETGLPRGVIRGGNIATQHDTSIKTFSNRMGNATIQANPDLLLGSSPTEESVLDEISQLVDLIYDQDETPKHICRRLYRFYVYHEVTPEIQSGIIQDMADVFVANDYKLAPVLEALFTSQEFYGGAAAIIDDAFGGIIKSPLDLTLGFIKNFGIEIPSAQTNVDKFYELTLSILGEMSAQGLDLYEPFEVAGYSAYHQFPLYNRSWISPNYLTNRYNFIRNRITPGDLQDIGDIRPLLFVQDIIPNATARDARALIISLIEYFLPMSDAVTFDGSGGSEMTQERMAYFLDALVGSMDADPETAWTTNWDNGTDPDKADNQLANLFNALLQTPEYQLM